MKPLSGAFSNAFHINCISYLAFKQCEQLLEYCSLTDKERFQTIYRRVWSLSSPDIEVEKKRIAGEFQFNHRKEFCLLTLPVRKYEIGPNCYVKDPTIKKFKLIIFLPSLRISVKIWLTRLQSQIALFHRS